MRRFLAVSIAVISVAFSITESRCEDEKSLGTNHPSTLTDLNNLITIYTMQGKNAEAEDIHKKILGIQDIPSPKN